MRKKKTKNFCIHSLLYVDLEVPTHRILLFSCSQQMENKKIILWLFSFPFSIGKNVYVICWFMLQNSHHFLFCLAMPYTNSQSVLFFSSFWIFFFTRAQNKIALSNRSFYLFFSALSLSSFNKRKYFVFFFFNFYFHFQCIYALSKLFTFLFSSLKRPNNRRPKWKPKNFFFFLIQI